jgi:hypothetical protein
MFDYLDYKNVIPLNKCVVDIPKLHPDSNAYEKFWIQIMKRKQIEGHWVEHEGNHQWMPGSIFQYVNLWTIELKKREGTSKGKVLGRPRLRDLEWIKGFVHAVARGFSGFKDDAQYSCHRMLINPEKDDLIPYLSSKARTSLYKPDGTLKEYKDALEYLYEYKKENLGKALFHNDALNVVDIEARNLGKSYILSNFSAHNFLTDGVLDFDEWWENKLKHDGDPTKDNYTTQTLISAIDSKYSKGLADKIRVGLDYLPGKQEINGIVYPAPLSKMYDGSWTAGKDIIAKYKKKVGGNWQWAGTYSGFLHRSFNDNPFAANGTRYGFGTIDEIGFCGNLIAVLGQLAECTTADGGEKYGTIWMPGTGGDMEGGATEAVKQVFYSPKAFDCVEFDDIFEGSPNKIGFFIPAWMSFDKYRDELGNVNKELAMKDLLKERAEKIKGSKKGYNDLLQMKPLKPSEAFLVSGGNIFDRPELGEWIAKLETERDGLVKGKAGYFVDTDNSNVEFRIDINAKPCDYPISEKDNKDGSGVMWKEPSEVVGDGSIPYGVFLGGLDPYAQDEAPNSVSLGCLLIFARATVDGQTYDELVFEYTARPESAQVFYENCRKALQYYNCLCLYENNYNQFKTHMQNKTKLHYLAKTPTALKNNKADAIANTYGLRMHNAGGHGLKEELEVYTRDWLYEEAGDGKLNLHHIYSIPLLKELKAYNDSGNFDRAISLMLFVAQKIQMHKITVQKKNDKIKSYWASNDGLLSRKRL